MVNMFAVFWVSWSKPLVSKLIPCLSKKIITWISEFAEKEYLGKYSLTNITIQM